MSGLSWTSETVKAVGAVLLAVVTMLGTIALAVIGHEIPQIVVVLDGAIVGYFFGVVGTNGIKDKTTANSAAIQLFDEARRRHEEANQAQVAVLKKQLVEKGVLRPEEALAPPVTPLTPPPGAANVPPTGGNV